MYIYIYIHIYIYIYTHIHRMIYIDNNGAWEIKTCPGEEVVSLLFVCVA